MCKSDFEKSGILRIYVDPINGCNHKKNAEGRTALHIATETKDLDKVRLLVGTQPGDANLTDKVCF